MPLGFAPIGSAALGAGAEANAPVVIPTFSIRLTDRNGNPLTSGLAVKAVWFDQNDPLAFTSPAWSGTLSVQSNGIVSHQIVSSILQPGDIGWLILSDSDGSPETPHKAFSGPVAVT